LININLRLIEESAIDLIVSADTSKNGENHEFQISSRNPYIVDDGIFPAHAADEGEAKSIYCDDGSLCVPEGEPEPECD